MKKILLALSVILICMSIGMNAQTTKNNLNYQPKTISDAVLQLNEVLTDSQKDEVRSVSEDDFMLGTSSALAKWIQQQWLYNKGVSGQNSPSSLRKYLVEFDVVNDDDMSDIILRTFYRWFNNKDLGLQEQVDAVRAKKK